MKRILVAEHCDPIHGWLLAQHSLVTVHEAKSRLAELQAEHPNLHWELGHALVGQYPLEINQVC